jgi:hypothetical protein
LGQALQVDPRLLGISLQKDLKLLDLSLFLYFFMKEKKINPWRMPLFFFFVLLFKPFTVDYTVQSTVKKLMPLVYFFLSIVS